MMLSARSGPWVASFSLAFLCLALLFLAACASGDASTLAEEGPPPPSAAAAIERSIAYLERDGRAWMEGTLAVQDGKGCVSCHQVPFALWALREAEAAGVAVPKARVAELDDLARAFVAQPDKGRVMSWTPLLLGRPQGEETPEAAASWTAFRDHIVASQRADGLWEARGQFPTQKRPREESDAVATLWTLLALESFRDETPSALASHDRAVGWLREAKPGESNEWLLARLLLHRALGEDEAAHELLEEVLATQQDDGGWSFAPGDPSNAFSTGQSLYTLRQTGLAAAHSAVERAVRYLLATQNADGTWTVPSHLTSKETGPAKDYIYDYWGTAWAVIGLAQG